ncbi:DUF2927 domain-containing protein [Aliiroseovarius crassostreae]|uniref:DUF2927 domain-containing protein n=1 Tax=Aliiroseovarius crassostreae TaxID=154981 RepID=A0A9Q9HAF0_9RHOB|nr:DUF2927 domain-containing protein [Aliiroseovarius crassostreae]UWP94619.1 DUF2927 domain-containing protein [Aliiroseovarius crassostreae]
MTRRATFSRVAGRAGWQGALLASSLLLSGCLAFQGGVRTSPVPQPRPAPAIYTPSAESVELAGYYERVQRGLLVQGLLRGDGGGVDTPFTDEMLARNFMRLAFSSEYALPGRAGQSGQSRAQFLNRWDGPVRLSLSFGASVDPDTRQQVTEITRRYATRLARITGLSISVLKPDHPRANMRIFIVDERERRALEARLSRGDGTLSAAAIRALISLDRRNYCHVLARAPQGTATLTKADVVIRTEIPPRMMGACLHEEIAQGLGIGNDSPQARPSIFNDDEEFGRLTTHDEMLLRILYDARLHPGMSADEARPIVTEIAAELVPPAHRSARPDQTPHTSQTDDEV